MITFRLEDPAGKVMDITVPAPKHWYHRWPLLLAAWIWKTVSEAENAGS